MHLLIPYASTLAEGAVHTLRDLQLPALARLLARSAPTLRLGSDETSLTPPHELAQAAALGWQAADGCLPWAALQAAQDGISDVAGHAWGLLTPAHWRVSAEGVTLVDPQTLALGEDESRALFDTVRELFESEGWRLHWGAPLRWYAAHESLRDLPCASLDRAIGRGVDDWIAPNARLSQVRRLQSEVQMLLYHAPVNDEREARGQLSVNSFWLHGCGAMQPVAATVDALQIDDRLRGPALAEDWAAWADAWRALDAGPIAALLARTEGGDAPVALTLCGERLAQRFEPGATPSLWSRLTRGLRAPPPATALEVL